MDKIFFSEDKRFYAKYFDKQKMLAIYDSNDMSKGCYTSIISIEHAELVARQKFEELNQSNETATKKLYYQEILEDYENNPTPENQEKVRFLLFVLKKMSPVNRKIYRVNSIIGQIEDLGIKIKKDYNPFE